MTEDETRGAGATADMPEHATDAPEQMKVRLAKVDRMRAEGIDPYPVGYPRTHTIAEVRNEFGELPADAATGKQVGVTGRVVLYRNGGKLCFPTIPDRTREIPGMISLDRARGQARPASQPHVHPGR